MALGIDVDGKVVSFDDFTIEVWDQIDALASKRVLETRPDGTDVRASWIDVYGWPLRVPACARLLHEEAVRVAEPGCPDVAARSRELAPTMNALKDAVTVVEDDVPSMVDGRPLAEGDTATSS